MPRFPRSMLAAMVSPQGSAERTDFELLDAGDGRRLERFGARVVDRPAPTATEPRRTPGAWWSPELRYAGNAWFGSEVALQPWRVSLGGVDLELRPTASGGLGVYPEHLANLDWLASRVAERAGRGGAGRAPTLLNLFAHTGLLTLAAARAGAAVTHVDGSRSAVAWARHNAELSGLADRPVRWIVDDALGFAEREGRRERRYDGIVLDPPSFGHANRRRWRLAETLPDLLWACRQVAAKEAFVLLTAHTTGLDGAALEAALRVAFPRAGRRVEQQPLELEATSGARLPLGWAVRLGGSEG